jgi:hypothetical protein
MSLKPMYVWDGSAWVQVGDASTPQTTIDIAQSAPQGAITGSIWYDDEAGGLFVYDGQYWVNISGPQGPQGASGATGLQGPQGLQGEPGASPDTSIFLTYSAASTIYLNQQSASSEYLTQLSASSTYLTIDSASATYITPNSISTLTNKILTSPTINDSNTNYPTFKSPTEISNIVASGATGTINIDAETSSLWYYTLNSSNNFTLNFRYNSSTSISSKLSVGESITIVFMNTNGTTAYYPNTIQVDGSNVTPIIQGGSAITSGNVSSIDVYSFTIIKTSSTPTYLVLESQTQFK